MDPKLLQACKPLVVNEFWKDLDILINSLIEAETQVLLNSTDIGSIRESQGKIKSYKHLRSLPDRIRSLDKR